MRNTYLLIPLLATVLFACDRTDQPAKPKSVTLESVDVDNTARNVRDSDFSSLTPGDQAQNNADLIITKTIRRALMNDGALSNNGQNVKIITVERVVTLRGVVANNQEKERIEKAAKAVGNVSRVDNQLEVKQK